jgi:hypothetical protein
LLRLEAINALLPRPGIELELLAVHFEMLGLALQRAQGGRARRQLRLEILALLRHQFYLSLDLFDLLLPILKDEQLLQFRLHARMLWAERTIVNRAEVDLLETGRGSTLYG